MNTFLTIRKAVLLGFVALAVVVKTEPTLPTLDLPWGIWPATVYENDDKIYVFRNVRFGAPPERFRLPKTPDWVNSTVQNITQDISCYQVNTSSLHKPPGGRNRLGDPENGGEKQCEDCLFLDIYVPASAFQPSATLLPVVVWIYGGAYAFGSKNPHGPLNSGQSILNASNYQTIFIAGNYRLGAFGWLAGDYMQTVGQPNAGLYDQALLLEWVQDYVYLVKGDKTRVSAWGESAGAGSILHHLLREDGERDPLFKTFAVQSPAFQWAWDNSHDGELDTIYKTFSNLSGCGFDYNIDCLTEVDSEVLKSANQGLFDSVRKKGLFPVGPSVDGDWIKSIPTVLFSTGRFWEGIESAIISHCTNEPATFTPNDINSEPEFDRWLYDMLPGSDLEPQRNKIKQQYCAAEYEGKFHNCAAAIIQDSSFTCNTRDLFESYPDISYMMQYAFPFHDLAFHATDLIPLFMNNTQDVIDILESIRINSTYAEYYAKLLDDKTPKAYKNYFASFALSGNPNDGPSSSPRFWSVADGRTDKLSNVMEVTYLSPHDGFNNDTKDKQNSKRTCSFWTDIATEIVSSQMNIDGDRSILPLSNVDEL